MSNLRLTIMTALDEGLATDLCSVPRFPESADLARRFFPTIPLWKIWFIERRNHIARRMLFSRMLDLMIHAHTVNDQIINASRTRDLWEEAAKGVNTGGLAKLMTGYAIQAENIVAYQLHKFQTLKLIYSYLGRLDNKVSVAVHSWHPEWNDLMTSKPTN